MVVHAYILVNVESGSEDTVLKQVKALNILDEAYVSLGLYDMIIKVKDDTLQGLKEKLSYKIRNIDQVRATLTLVIM